MILAKRTACRLSVSKSDNKDSSLLITSALSAYTNWPHSYYLLIHFELPLEYKVLDFADW